jgi:hypothetical protein
VNFLVPLALYLGARADLDEGLLNKPTEDLSDFDGTIVSDNSIRVCYSHFPVILVSSVHNAKFASVALCNFKSVCHFNACR